MIPEGSSRKWAAPELVGVALDRAVGVGVLAQRSRCGAHRADQDGQPGQRRQKSERGNRNQADPLAEATPAQVEARCGEQTQTEVGDDQQAHPAAEVPQRRMRGELPQPVGKPEDHDRRTEKAEQCSGERDPPPGGVAASDQAEQGEEGEWDPPLVGVLVPVVENDLRPQPELAAVFPGHRVRNHAAAAREVRMQDDGRYPDGGKQRKRDGRHEGHRPGPQGEQVREYPDGQRDTDDAGDVIRRQHGRQQDREEPRSALFHPGARRARTAPMAARGKNRFGYCRTWKSSGIRQDPDREGEAAHPRDQTRAAELD